MPDEPIPNHPTAPIAPETHLVMLQGGPMHMRMLRVKADHDDITLDQGGNLPPLTYRRRRGVETHTGALFDFVVPPKAEKADA
jgi:hypothetical protein